MRVLLATTVGLMLVVAAGGCTPDIGEDPPPTFVEMQFDSTAAEPRVPQPTASLINPVTKLIDFTAAGIDVPGVPDNPAEPVDPAVCQVQQVMPVAQCEFLQYLERLDGYPTVMGASAPTSAPLDLATVSLPGTVFVLDLLHNEVVTDMTVGFDETQNLLTLDPAGGWNVGGFYLVAVRGYGASGVRGVQGEDVVSSSVYVFLKQEESLTCGAATVEAISPDCVYYQLLAGELDPAEVPASLMQLEQLRQLFRGELADAPFDSWGVAQEAGGMPKEEVAILWLFPTHSNPVAELNPSTGQILTLDPTTKDEVRVAVKGAPIKEETLSLFAVGVPNAADASVFFLDVSDPALPVPQAATLSFEEGAIVMRLSTALTDGHTYVVALTNDITDTSDRPLVPSPVTVLLRTRGPVVSESGVSNVSGVSDADAAEAEAGRLQFVDLFDSDLVKQLTTSAKRPNGLTREHIAYVWGFVSPNP